MSPPLPTSFAPAERASSDELRRQRQTFCERYGDDGVIDHAPVISLILNRHRQIVQHNRALLDAMEITEPEQIIGQRPGETLGCAHAHKTAGGCGTTESCRHCGAVLAILAAQQTDQRTVRECLLRRDHPDPTAASAEFQVVADPVHVDHEPYVIFNVTDVSSAKRRAYLEDVFVHDLRNLVMALKGQIDLLADAPESVNARVPTLTRLSDAVADSLENQRVLTQAERGTLHIDRQIVSLPTLMREFLDLAACAPFAVARSVRLADGTPLRAINTDRGILRRVVFNMLKNALEATEFGGTVALGATENEDSFDIWVHNTAVIPDESRSRVFQRSFSTKGPNRGLGTYGMRLLAERYLGGRVDFTSAESEGTRFYVRLPARAS